MKIEALATLIGIAPVLAASAAGHVFLKQTSQTGIQGWTVAADRHSGGSWMNSILILISPDGGKKQIRSSYAFIEKWGFSDGDATVVIRARQAHGPSWIQKFDVSSCKLLAECQGSGFLGATPIWARPWCDEADRLTEPQRGVESSSAGASEGR
jgi:hypothetical protein